MWKSTPNYVDFPSLSPPVLLMQLLVSKPKFQKNLFGYNDMHVKSA